MIAHLFPGQGARDVLSGIALARTLDPGLYALALAEAGVTDAQLHAEEGRALERTEVLQPLLTACALAISARLPAPDLVLGHSLGELAAASAAGAFDAATAVRLAALRGRLMAREADRHPGGLAAWSGVGPQPGGLELAAVNAPDERVYGGPWSALGAPLKKLPVSGAWHTRAMAGAVDEFEAALAATRPRALQIPLVRNLDGEATRSTDSLARQIAAPVQLAAAFQRLAAADTLVTVGPGLVLRGLARKNLGLGARVLTTEDPADLKRLAS